MLILTLILTLILEVPYEQINKRNRFLCYEIIYTCRRSVGWYDGFGTTTHDTTIEHVWTRGIQTVSTSVVQQINEFDMRTIDLIYDTKGYVGKQMWYGIRTILATSPYYTNKQINYYIHISLSLYIYIYIYIISIDS